MGLGESDLSQDGQYFSVSSQADIITVSYAPSLK